MGSASPGTHKSFLHPGNVPAAPEDPLYSLVAAYENDESPHKVDVGVGAYRDDNAKPWILPAVRKATRIIADDPLYNHEYTPIAGLPEFVSAAQKLIVGADSVAITEQRICSLQAISGTGAVHLGGLLLAKFLTISSTDPPHIYISRPSWPIHRQCFENVRLRVEEYPYFNVKTRMLDLEGMLSTLRRAPSGSIILLHACAHNPTGVDPTEDRWKQIADVMQTQGLFPFFDCAYQGFATGSLTRDNLAIRHFVDRGFELVIAQSFAKNMGLYGQRVGAFHYVAAPGPHASETTNRVASQLAIFQRSEISSPPIYGAKVASIILNDETLFGQWEDDLRTMADRIVAMRLSLKRELDNLGTPGTWDHITRQIGMFSFTGLTEAQVDLMRTDWHIYMLGNGRVSMAGLNNSNIKYFARAVDNVVRRIT